MATSNTPAPKNATFEDVHTPELESDKAKAQGDFENPDLSELEDQTVIEFWDASSGQTRRMLRSAYQRLGF